MSMQKYIHTEHGECWIGDHQDDSEFRELGWIRADEAKLKPQGLDQSAGEKERKQPADQPDDQPADRPLSVIDDLQHWTAAYDSCGITTVGQLAALTVTEIDALEIKGLGARRAEQHAAMVAEYLDAQGE